jgi:hypothetical protein
MKESYEYVAIQETEHCELDLTTCRESVNSLLQCCW